MTLLRTPELTACHGVIHGFTTREGGVSTGPWGEMTLAARPELSDAELLANWARALDELGELGVDRVALISQVHGAEVVEVRVPRGPLMPVAEADGCWTAVSGLVLAVRVADCVPVLLAAPGGVAVAHAGWRGTAAGVVGRTVQALCEGTGCAPAEVVAAVGPCISGAAYEVGPEVVAGLRSAGLRDEDFVHPTEGPRAHVDLGRAALAQLRAAGVGAMGRIERCTLGDEALHSHRRDGASSGRLAGLVART